MNVERFGNLYKLTKWGIVNAYLVQEEDGLTLVDCLIPGNQDAISAAAADIGQTLKRIVITHAHADHTGSLDGLKTAVPTAQLLMTERTQQLLSGQHTVLPSEPQVKLRGSYATADSKPDRIIEVGEQIGSLEVVAAPGHTPDHIALFDRRDGTLIAGDAMQTLGGTAVAGTIKWLFPFPALATWHKSSAVESAKRMVALKPTRLAVGHGKMLENPVSAMQQAIREAEGG